MAGISNKTIVSFIAGIINKDLKKNWFVYLLPILLINLLTFMMP